MQSACKRFTAEWPANTFQVSNGPVQQPRAKNKAQLRIHVPDNFLPMFARVTQTEQGQAAALCPVKGIVQIKQKRPYADGERLPGFALDSALLEFWLFTSFSNHAFSQSGPKHAEAGAGDNQLVQHTCFNPELLIIYDDAPRYVPPFLRTVFRFRHLRAKLKQARGFELQ